MTKNFLFRIYFLQTVSNKIIPRLFFIVCYLLIILFKSYAQNYPVDLLREYSRSKPDTNRVKVLIQLSSFYLDKILDIQTDLDSALMFAKQARQLSTSLKYKRGEDEANFYIGRVYVDGGDYTAVRTLLKELSDTTRIKVMVYLADDKLHSFGKTRLDFDTASYYAKLALEQCKVLHSITLEAEATSVLVEYYTLVKNFKTARPIMEKGIESCKEAGYPAGIARILSQCLKNLDKEDKDYAQVKSIWKTTLATCKNDSEKKDMLTVPEYIMEKWGNILYIGSLIDLPANGEYFCFRIIDLFGEIVEPTFYADLCYVYSFEGDLTKALFYGLKAEKLAEDNSKKVLPDFTYNIIGQVYFRRGNMDESFTYFQKALAVLRREGLDPNGNLIKYITRVYVAKNQPQEAATFLEEISKAGTKYTPFDMKDIFESKGIVYLTMKKYDKAEQCFMESLKLTKGMHVEVQLTIYAELSRLYLQAQQYDKAHHYLDILEKKENRFFEPLFIQEELALLRFRVDSAQGNYKSAVIHLQENKLLHDSIFNETKNQQFEELKIKYETDQKDKDFRILEGKEKLTHEQLQNARNTQYWIIAGAMMLLIIAGLFYRQAVVRKKNNKIIKNKNGQLQHLLTEKDWLVKEIHHRVKNNLQIVMSLLNSQSAYIDNELALTAIHDSQHRVHAMSLIHQKLYGSENVSSIDMSLYIREMVSYLSESFNTGQRVRFELAIEPLEMDVSQAVPLGLILNEAITNSIKYAFPNDRSGVISISLSNTDLHNYLLTISDNGIGMPVQVKYKKPGSLGMSLMTGLSEDLDGNFSIESKNGTTIRVSFVHDPGIKRQDILTSSFVSNN